MYCCKMLLATIALSFFTIACSGPALFTVQPEDEQFEYYNGKKVLTASEEDLSVSVNYEHQDNGYFVFYVYILNESDEAITVDPAEFYYETNDPPKVENKIYALDPEKEIQTIESNLDELDESHATNVGLNCLFATFEVVADIAEGDGDEAVWDAGHWVDNMADEQQDYEVSQSMLKNHKMFWENETFRITTLNRNDEIGGLVYVPISEDVLKFSLILSAADKEFVFPFKQKRK